MDDVYKSKTLYIDIWQRLWQIQFRLHRTLVPNCPASFNWWAEPSVSVWQRVWQYNQPYAFFIEQFERLFDQESSWFEQIAQAKTVCTTAIDEWQQTLTETLSLLQGDSHDAFTAAAGDRFSMHQTIHHDLLQALTEWLLANIQFNHHLSDLSISAYQQFTDLAEQTTMSHLSTSDVYQKWLAALETAYLASTRSPAFMRDYARLSSSGYVLWQEYQRMMQRVSDDLQPGMRVDTEKKLTAQFTAMRSDMEALRQQMKGLKESFTVEQSSQHNETVITAKKQQSTKHKKPNASVE